MVVAPTSKIRWHNYHRLINSAYPPIDLFEDIADPADWLLLGNAEAKTNARVASTIGKLDLTPPKRRVGGAGSSYVMAPFTHTSPLHKGRFNDGTFGVFYAADSFETALFETIHHMQKLYSDTKQARGWLSDFREVVGNIDATLADITGDGFDHLLDKNDYAASQAFALDIKNQGVDGIIYPSVRNQNGLCFAAFYPDVMSVPVQARHIRYHWNGTYINMVRNLDTDEIFEIEL